MDKLLVSTTIMAVTNFLNQISKILLKTFKQIDDSFSNSIEYWKWENRTEILEKAKKIAEDNKLSLRKIAPNFLVPFLDNARNTDEHELQNLWANLLCNSMMYTVHPSYIKILSEISVVEAKFLDDCVAILSND